MKTKTTLSLFMGMMLLSTSSFGQAYWPEDFVTNKATNTYTEVGTVQDGLDSPVDLDFNKKDPTELWVINMRTENVGGNTVTYRNVGTASQQAFLKKDGNSWHFMSLPTALAFGSNGNWANSPGVFDANHRGGASAPFTGPSLWSSDFAIYAQNAGPGTNGSHLDMLHGSPYSVGIAWHKDNEYFTFDGYNGHVAMYDFAIDHGPGNSNHDDGRLRRYPEISLKRLGLVPGHMEIDPQRKWLYINDIGNKRIVRIDITSGTVKGTSSVRASERLAENVDMENVTWEVVASTGLDKPCGLDVTEDRLVITDNGTNEIIVYDLTQTNGFPELGRIKLSGYTNVMGIKLDGDGKMWFVDKTAKTVVRIDNDNVKKRNAVGIKEISPVDVNVFPNPFNDKLTISGLEAENFSVSIYDLSGKSVIQIESSLSEINLGELTKGMYFMHIINDQGNIIHSEKILKQ
ncbi:MAG: hypothetical protein CL840_17295 [Crocinitomicaceae bacterium]|nr:hypothetical protein [Crocinitomicaceae bacterium]